MNLGRRGKDASGVDDDHGPRAASPDIEPSYCHSECAMSPSRLGSTFVYGRPR